MIDKKSKLKEDIPEWWISVRWKSLQSSNNDDKNDRTDVALSAIIDGISTTIIESHA